ncbi:hypothetical protein EG359_06115 [Chryseobacterium joostei]|uniref:DUF2442 domain-containing protein n=1 Tax=Chryseobacterium joostei TaxID=112234 RepID=A0A1N7HT03_9FLAO|nr:MULTISPECIES: hypothetical protein [Chryseobacterium]AZA99204.1 hypothetical protein EG359_06115 [Chryseobacterium joostei]RXM63155.1 hypothetical protein BOQ60_17570 [Chryseobacterium sp. CH1]SIS27977.1 hypothetical protein SAMN05421768_101136 [Chryseobacterium joostei]
MKVDLRIPKKFVIYQKWSVFSNFDNEVDYNVASWIQGKNYCAEFTASNFHGLVWWNDELGYWCDEIWQDRVHKSSYMAERL